MLSVKNMPFMLNVVMLSVIMLNVMGTLFNQLIFTMKSHLNQIHWYIVRAKMWYPSQHIVPQVLFVKMGEYFNMI
jgi:hypothetical protein